MAKFNEILVGRYNRFLQKLLSMKGPASMAQLAAEMQPVFPFFNGVENRYLEGWYRFGVTVAPGTPAAGNRAAVRIRNPLGSNVMAVIEKLTIAENAGADFPLITADSIATAMAIENGTGTVRNLESRQQQTGANSIVTTSVNFGAVGTPMFQGGVLNGTSFDFILFEDQELALSPNQQYTVASNALAQNFICSIVWRERFLEDSERA